MKNWKKYSIYPILLGSTLLFSGCNSFISVNSTEEYEKAVAAEKGHDYAAARVHLLNVVRAEPDNARAQLLFAKVLNLTGDPIGAEAALDRIYSVGEAGGELADNVLVERVRAKFFMGKYKEVIDLSEKAPRDSGVVRWAEIMAHDALGDYIESESLLKEALVELPQSAPLLALKASRALAIEDRMEAKRFIERGLKADPDHIDVLLVAANLARLEKQDNKAKEYLNHAAKQYPASPYPTLLLGQFEYARGDTEKAKDYYNRSLRITPYYVDALLGLGRIALDAGDVEEAHILLQKIEGRSGRSFEKSLQKLEVAYHRGNNASAIREGRRLVARAPYADRAVYYLARALERKGDIRGALKEIRSLIAHRTESPQTLEYGIELARKLNDMDAVNMLEKRIILKKQELAAL